MTYYELALTINGKVKNYERGELIFKEGDECKSIGLVLNGEVKIVTSSLLFNEFTISIVKEKQSFGTNLLFSNTPVYLGDVIANKKTTIKLISKNDFIDFVSKNTLVFLEENSKKNMLQQQKVKVLLQKSIKEKILFFLYNETKFSKSNNVYIKSKEELAKYLNVERPSLSRELANLKKYFIY